MLSIEFFRSYPSRPIGPALGERGARTATVFVPALFVRSRIAGIMTESLQKRDARQISGKLWHQDCFAKPGMARQNRSAKERCGTCPQLIFGFWLEFLL
ncbi:hypothetical protein [Metarhizobium album]|uniref:hypothetical protein n=1 Tax=Metarhizobium album TaxID=2182425 RepID=UPI0014040BD4|nr:hypothetical protein [Rhizobium album]